jgi:hypothetical protein
MNGDHVEHVPVLRAHEGVAGCVFLIEVQDREPREELVQPGAGHERHRRIARPRVALAEELAREDASGLEGGRDARPQPVEPIGRAEREGVAREHEVGMW